MKHESKTKYIATEEKSFRTYRKQMIAEGWKENKERSYTKGSYITVIFER